MVSSCDWRKTYACADGVSREFQWRADRSAGTLRWQARRVYLSAGFEERSEKTMFHVCWRRESPKLRSLLEEQGMPLDVALGDSGKAIRAKTGGAGTASTSEQAWLCTIALLYQLLMWTRARRRAEDQRLAQYCLQQLVAYGCGGQRQCITDVPPEVSTLCWSDVDDSSLCSHMREALRTSVHNVAPHLTFCTRLEGLYLHRSSCEACRQWLHVQIGLTAGMLDEGSSDWQNGSTIELSPLRGVKGHKRALDQHERQQVRDGKKSDVPANQVHKELVRHLLHVQAQSQSTFGSRARIIASCLDSGRVGKPPRDHIMHWMCDLEANVAMIAAPVVHARMRTPSPQSPDE
eukprot:5849058-Amphidinium_carterae.1